MDVELHVLNGSYQSVELVFSISEISRLWICHIAMLSIPKRNETENRDAYVVEERLPEVEIAKHPTSQRCATRLGSKIPGFPGEV